jgi:predicted nucleotidyltransferase
MGSDNLSEPILFCYNPFMSLEKAEQKERTVQEAIVNLLAYFAIWGIRLDFSKLYSYLQVRSGELMVKKQLDTLVKSGKIKQVNGLYGLKKQKYPASTSRRVQQAKLLRKAKRWSRAIGLLPFVKSVVVINSTAYGNVHDESDIDLFVVTTPNRIFLTKGALMYMLKLLGQLETEYRSAGRFSLGMFITTKGAKMDKDMMKVNEPDLVYRMITGIPVYGGGVWYDILKNDSYLNSRLPNYIWPKHSSRIYGLGWRALDRLDEIGYKRHLKHTSSQAKSHHPDAFIRVRPDIINLHHRGTSAQIAEKWLKIRSKA